MEGGIFLGGEKSVEKDWGDQIAQTDGYLYASLMFLTWITLATPLFFIC